MKNQLKELAKIESGYIVKDGGYSWYSKERTILIQSSLKRADKDLIDLAVKKYGLKEVVKVITSERGRVAEIKRKENALKIEIASAKKFKVSRPEFRKLYEKAIAIASDFRTGYSMGEKISVCVEGELMAYNDTRSSYSGKFKGRENYGYATINLTKKEIRAIRNVQGLWTIVNPDGSAKWLTSSGAKQHFCIFWETGFVYERSHSQKSLADARLLEIRKIQAEDREKQRKEDYEAYLNRLKLRFVGKYQLHEITGACYTGIEAFCRRHNLDFESGYNVGYLLSLGDSYANSYLTRL